MALQHLRSSTANKRPTGSSMSEGQIALNTNTASPGVFFKDSGGALIKVGPVHIGTSAPNSSPAGSTGNAIGEQWLDTTGGGYVFKIWDGTAWRSESGTFVDVSGDTMTGALILPSGTAAAPALGVGSTDNGVYSPGADQVAISTNGAGRLFIDASGNVGINTTSPGFTLDIKAATDGLLRVNNSNESSHGSTDARIVAGGNFYQNPVIVGSSIKFNTYNGSAEGERARIDSSGRLLVGTSSESGNAKHVVRGNTGSSTGAGVLDIGLGTTRPGSAGTPLGYIRFTSTSNTSSNYHYAAIYAESDGTSSSDTDIPGRLVFSTTADEASSPTPRMTIKNNGNVGIGTTSPSQRLNLNIGGDQTWLQIDKSRASDEAMLQLVHTATNRGSRIRYANADSSWTVGIDGSESFVFTSGEDSIGAGGTERARIDSSGRLLVGTSSSAGNYKVQISGEDLYLSGASSYSGYANIRLSSDRARISSQLEASGGTPGASLQFYTMPTNGSITERMRIDSLGRVGIGTSSPDQNLHVYGNSGTTFVSVGDQTRTAPYGYFGADASAGKMSLVSRSAHPLAFQIQTSEVARFDTSGRLLVGTSGTSQSARAIFEGNNSSSAGVIRLACANSSPANGDVIGSLVYAGDDHDNVGDIYVSRDGGTWTQGSSQPTRMVFSTTADGASSPTERMRITSEGCITNKTSGTINSVSTQGWALGPKSTDGGYFIIRRDNNTAMHVNRGSDDGGLINFYGQSVNEGSISVSGTTVSYNGAHLARWSQLPGGVERTEILRGSVLSNIDEMCEWGEENNEQLNRMQVSNVEGDRNVSGVFQAWDDDDDTYINDFYCAMTGDFVIRIAQGVTVERGDLLMSAGDGTAKPQEDDIIRSKTIAKVTSTNVSETYADGSYCVPCVLMAC